jgi:hypothetical protein
VARNDGCSIDSLMSRVLRWMWGRVTEASAIPYVGSQPANVTSHGAEILRGTASRTLRPTAQRPRRLEFPGLWPHSCNGYPVRSRDREDHRDRRAESLGPWRKQTELRCSIECTVACAGLRYDAYRRLLDDPAYPARRIFESDVRPLRFHEGTDAWSLALARTRAKARRWMGRPSVGRGAGPSPAPMSSPSTVRRPEAARDCVSRRTPPGNAVRWSGNSTADS